MIRQVDPSLQFAAAWQEISARIQSRDGILGTFIILSASIVGLALSKRDLSITVVAIGYASLAMTLLNGHHDIIIGQLARFQADMCSRGRSWFALKYRRPVYFARGMREWSEIAVIALGLGASVFVAFPELPNYSAVTTIAWWGSIGSSFAAIATILVVHFSRKALSNSHGGKHGHHT